MSDVIAAPEGFDVVPVNRLDEIEARLVNRLGAQVQAPGEVLEDFPVIHRFTPGMYVREIFMPAGSIIVSRTHKTEHPFVVSQGRLAVFIEGVGWKEFEAPYTGITKVGTRRLLVVFEDTIWTTFHPTDLTDLLEIDAALLEPHANPLLQPERIEACHS